MKALNYREVNDADKLARTIDAAQVVMSRYKNATGMIRGIGQELHDILEALSYALDETIDQTEGEPAPVSSGDLLAALVSIGEQINIRLMERPNITERV